MKKLFVTLFVLAVFVANAQTDSLYIPSICSPAYYNEDEDCLDIRNWCADTLIIYDDDPYSIEIGAVHWYSYNEGQWLTSSSITITKENEGRWSYYNYHTGMGFDFYITLATTPEETKVSFDREVPLGEEIFAYDLINDVENPKLSIAWDDGESGYSRTACEERVYTVTVSDSCGRQVTNTWRVGDWTGTNESLVSTPYIFPNPSNGVFTIEGEGVYSIYNTVGQLVKTVNLEGRQEIVLPSGLYFVRNDETTMKVVVR